MDQMGFFESMALSVLFNVLKIVIKNPEKKAAMQKALLKLRDAINSAYPDQSGQTVQAVAAAPPSIVHQIENAVASVASDAVAAVTGSQAHGGVSDGW